MVRKGSDTLFYISLGLIFFSFLILLTTFASCAILRRRRRRYCSNCSQLLRLENTILRRGIGAVSHESILRAKTAISTTLTENPEYRGMPTAPPPPSHSSASNPHYAPVSEKYTTMCQSSEGGSACELGSAQFYGLTKQEYEYMRSPKLNARMIGYVNMKSSNVSINSVT